MKTKKYHNGSISSVHFHFPEAFLLFISSSDLPRGVGLCLFPVTSLKRIHWIPLVITPNSTYISSGLTNLNWKWKDIDQSVQKSEVLEKIPFHFDINLFSERKHRDGHTTQNVKKIVVSKTYFIKKNCPDLSKSNFDVKIEENFTLENCY